MKFLFLFSTSTLTGQAAQSYNILKYLAESGQKVITIIDQNREGNLRDYLLKADAKIIDTVSISNKNKIISKYAEINRVHSIIMDMRPDFIVSSFSNDHFTAVLANKKSDFKGKIIRFFHSRKVRKDIIHKRLFENTDIFIFYDFDIYLDFKRKYPELEKRIYLLPPSIDTELFIVKNRDETRRYFGLKSDIFVVGYTGMFQRGRMHRELIKSFYEYKKLNRESKLLIVGSGETFDKIKKYSECVLRDDVIFTGFVSDERLVDAYNAMDLFLLLKGGHDSSLRMLYEAQSCGTYILTYKNYPALRLLEVTNYGGFLSDVNDKKGIGNSIYDSQKVVNDSLRISIHKKVREEFGIDKIGKLFLKICEDL
ncbi:MAG: glycosyltransferase family 4 protein [Myxococcota bacterium]